MWSTTSSLKQLGSGVGVTDLYQRCDNGQQGTVLFISHLLLGALIVARHYRGSTQAPHLPFYSLCQLFVAWHMTTCGTSYPHHKLHCLLGFIGMSNLQIQLKLAKVIASTCSFHAFILLCRTICFQRKLTVKSVLSAQTFFLVKIKTHSSTFCLLPQPTGNLFSPWNCIVRAKTWSSGPHNYFPCAVFLCME